MIQIAYLTGLFESEQIVEQIIDADDPAKTFREIRRFYAIALNDFKNEHEECYNGEILAKGVVQSCVVCMMAKVDDYEVFLNYEELPKALHQVTGKLEKVARKLEKFLLAGECFSDYNLADLIERFFIE